MFDVGELAQLGGAGGAEIDNNSAALIPLLNIREDGLLLLLLFVECTLALD